MILSMLVLFGCIKPEAPTALPTPELLPGDAYYDYLSSPAGPTQRPREPVAMAVAAPSPLEEQEATAPSSWTWPVDGYITSLHGPRWGRIHRGIDIGAPQGTPVYAAAPGRVVLAEPRGDYGNLLIVEHADGLQTRYAHLVRFTAGVGDPVGPQTELGQVGSTGTTTGPHLHFEVRLDGEAVPPREVLPWSRLLPDSVAAAH